MTYFITFNLHAVEQAIDELHKYMARKTAEDDQLKSRLKQDLTLNSRQRAVLGRALRDPSVQITIESHAASQVVAYATARADLLWLASNGYLQKQRSGRRFVFVPAPNLREVVRGELAS